MSKYNFSPEVEAIIADQLLPKEEKVAKLAQQIVHESILNSKKPRYLFLDNKVICKIKVRSLKVDRDSAIEGAQ